MSSGSKPLLELKLTKDCNTRKPKINSHMDFQILASQCTFFLLLRIQEFRSVYWKSFWLFHEIVTIFFSLFFRWVHTTRSWFKKRLYGKFLFVYVIYSFQLLTPRRCRSNFTSVIFKQLHGLSSRAILVKLLSGECHRTPLLISPNLFKEMAWCCQATGHYLSQCWFMSVNGNGLHGPWWLISEKGC